jgi:hypothetical protein
LLDTVIGTVAAPQPITVTGAGANTVVLANVIFDRAGSTIPVGAEATTTIVDFSGNVRSATHSGVPLTATGSAADRLTAAGTYVEQAFGRHVKVTPRFTPLATTNPPPGDVFIAHTTGIVTAGTYCVVLQVQVQGSAANTQLFGTVVVDGVNQGGFQIETGIANGVYPFTAVVSVPFTAGDHTIDMRIGLGGGSGTVTALAGQVKTYKESTP